MGKDIPTNRGSIIHIDDSEQVYINGTHCGQFNQFKEYHSSDGKKHYYILGNDLIDNQTKEKIGTMSPSGEFIFLNEPSAESFPNINLSSSNGPLFSPETKFMISIVIVKVLFVFHLLFLTGVGLTIIILGIDEVGLGLSLGIGLPILIGVILFNVLIVRFLYKRIKRFLDKTSNQKE